MKYLDLNIKFKYSLKFIFDATMLMYFKLKFEVAGNLVFNLGWRFFFFSEKGRTSQSDSWEIIFIENFVSTFFF